MSATFVLVHSPLTGPEVWQPVADALRAAGHDAVVPELTDTGLPPFWPQLAASASTALTDVEGPLVFVPHSGAGPIIASIAAAVGIDVDGYVFVDAGLPEPGSRLEAIEREGAPFAEDLRRHLESGGRFPEWTDADLTDTLSDPAARRVVLAHLRPRGLDYFTELLDVPAGWPEAPCAYLQWGAPYATAAAAARANGWPVEVHEAGHFHMLVDPARVARDIIDLSRRISGSP
ncbi:MAG: alpha/beta hydrolase [Actinobacteria bacterium]|nr:alpha/beta hydrolase [Actinomycetota bacterium]